MLIEKLQAIVGDGGWSTDEQELEPHLTEWRDTWRGRTCIMVAPETTEQVAAVVRACAEARVGIVPQGGNTGLCGGAIPDATGSQVLVSLSRLNRIRKISADDHSMIAEAGCTLASLQEAAAGAGRYFPLSLAAEGSCQIGGNISTNAGGINVLRYGTAREQVLGLEVVLPSGKIWNGLRALRKDTAGYDLKQFFIGAEGTLGIITAACLRLYPAIRHPKTAVASVDSPENAVSLLARLRNLLSDQLQAFELIPSRAIRFVLRHIPGTRFPLEQTADWFILLESSGGGGDELEDALMSCIEDGLAIDAVVAKNRGEADDLWRLRHSISEAQKREGASVKHDVSVPIAEVGRFIREADVAVTEEIPGIRVVAFGHLGDGNVHFNLSQPKDWAPERFLAERERLADRVYEVVQAFGGSISAEHGIGQGKREHLRKYRDGTDIELMQSIKQAFDPHHIMNPGKVI